MAFLVKNALVYRDNKFEKLDVLIENNIIINIADSICDNGVLSVFNCDSKYYLIPGFVDVHVHLREPGFSYKETVKTGTLAAAKSGYTTICPMPNVDPAPDSVENIRIQTDIIKRDAVIKTIPYASITKGRTGHGELVDFKSLKDIAVAFSDDGCGVQDYDLIKEAMLRCKNEGKILAEHCEVNSLLNGGYIHDGEYCKTNNHKGISSASEYEMIQRDCDLALETGVNYHVCHISTKESVEIIRQAKKKGAKVTCETGPHYLTLSDKDLKEEGRFKMNPPLRSEEDKIALLEGIVDGTIDVIATDHAPHSEEEKSRGLAKSPMGITGLETAFPVMYTKLVKEKIISLEKLVDIMSVKPREIFNLDGGKIEVGEIADLALLDLDTKYTIDSNEFVSMGHATPFDGWEVYGQNVLTICDGRIVYEKA